MLVIQQDFVSHMMVHYKANILCAHENLGTRSALHVSREVDLLLAGPSILSLGQDVRKYLAGFWGSRLGYQRARIQLVYYSLQSLSYHYFWEIRQTISTEANEIN